MLRRLLAAVLAAACFAVPARAVAPTPPQPVLFDGDESAATADGARAVLYNPAGLGLRYPEEFFFGWAKLPHKGQINEFVADWHSAALSFRRVKDSSQTWGFTFGAGREDRLRVGFGSFWLLDARTHEVDADHRLGLLSRPAPWLSLGAVGDHLFQPIFKGDLQARTYTLALGVRPLALLPSRAADWGTRVTLTTDFIVADDGQWSQTRVRVGGEVEALPGIAVRGSVTDHGGVHVGLSLAGPRSRVGGQTASHAGDHLYDAYAFSLHPAEDRTVLAGRVERRVAAVRAEGALGDDALAGLSLFGGENVTPVKPLREQLRRALEDPLTRGVLLDVRGVSNMAQIEELRPYVARLRAAGKPVVAYLEEDLTRADLYLAGACDRIVAAPEVEPSGLGLRVERRYYRRLLAQWGVRVDRTSYGKYKSAFRNYSVDSTTAADREALDRQLDVQQELFVGALAADRHLDRARVTAYLDGRPWRAADLAAAGLLDSVGYREDALRLLGTLCGLGDKPRTVTLRRDCVARVEWAVPSPIAVIYASGGIETGRSGGDLLMGPSMGSATVVRQLETAFRDRRVKAVVLRVESPGGSALASDLIHHATVRMKRETRKPFVVSMGALAGSGGYYIASGGDRIFCDRFTRTGSIGVVSVKPSFEQFYARHDVRQDDFQRGDAMRGWSMNHDWTPAEQAMADSATLRFYHAFVSTVAADRRLGFEAVDAVGQGRVWMGGDALDRGLVDAIGGLDEAIAEARRRARVPEGEKIRLIELRRPRPGLVQRLVGAQLRESLEGATRMPAPGAALYWTDDDGTP